MNYSRRDLRFLLPALAAAGAAAQNAALPSQIFGSDGQNKSRKLMKGETHSGYALEMHLTELAPGMAPHPPHHHIHEEAIFIHEGTLEVTILGRSAKLGPGSVAYVASNEEHGWKNVGSGPAFYLVLELGPNS